MKSNLVSMKKRDDFGMSSRREWHSAREIPGVIPRQVIDHVNGALIKPMAHLCLVIMGSIMLNVSFSVLA